MPSHFSRVWLSATLWPVALQAPLSIGFSRQEDWSGLPFPPPGDLPDPGIELTSFLSTVLAGEFFAVEPLAKPRLLAYDRMNPLHCEWQSDKMERAWTLLDNLEPLNLILEYPCLLSVVKAMVFPVIMCGCESWTIKKAEGRRIDAFELWCWRRLFESPLDCKEIQPVHPKGNQSWIFIGRTDMEAETPILWPPDLKN